MKEADLPLYISSFTLLHQNITVTSQSIVWFRREHGVFVTNILISLSEYACWFGDTNRCLTSGQSQWLYCNFDVKTHEPIYNEPWKDWKKTSLSLGGWNSSTEQVFISGSISGWNQRFYKQKAQVLQLNSAGHFKRRGIMRHKGQIHARPFCWHVSPIENPGGKCAE